MLLVMISYDFMLLFNVSSFPCFLCEGLSGLFIMVAKVCSQYDAGAASWFLYPPLQMASLPQHAAGLCHWACTIDKEPQRNHSSLSFTIQWSALDAHKYIERTHSTDQFCVFQSQDALFAVALFTLCFDPRHFTVTTWSELMWRVKRTFH